MGGWQAAAEAGLELRQVPRFDERADQLWDAVAPVLGFSVRRDTAYLNWKFADHHYHAYVLWLAERAGELRGYIVLRREDIEGLTYGYRVDLLTDPNEPEPAMFLVRSALMHFHVLGVDLVKVLFSWDAYSRVLSALRFIRTSASPGFLVFANDTALITRLRNPAEWHVTKGDSDLGAV